MMDNTFYKQFLNYEYILIYQLDAFVFKDELNYCSQGIDYVGAPGCVQRIILILLKLNFKMAAILCQAIQY